MQIVWISRFRRWLDLLLSLWERQDQVWVERDIFHIRTVRHIHLLSLRRRVYRDLELDRTFFFSFLSLTFRGHCARKAQGCNEGTKFRPVISDWTCYKNYEPCPKDSQVGWCNKCWCNKGYDTFMCRYLITDTTQRKTSSDASLICWRIRLRSGQRNFMLPNLKSGFLVKIMAHHPHWQQQRVWLMQRQPRDTSWDGEKSGRGREERQLSRYDLFKKLTGPWNVNAWKLCSFVILEYELERWRNLRWT